MYELKQVGPQSYYINSPAKIGIYRQSGNEVYLIDSGNDREAAKKVLKIAGQNGWRIKGIINTHSNADHIGGNQYIQKRTGCPIFASGIEGAFTRHPILEPSFLFGGYPFKELRSKFLLTKESEVTDCSSPGFPSELELIPLPGHFFDMVGSPCSRQHGLPGGLRQQSVGIGKVWRNFHLRCSPIPCHARLHRNH